MLRLKDRKYYRQLLFTIEDDVLLAQCTGLVFVMHRGDMPAVRERMRGPAKEDIQARHTRGRDQCTDSAQNAK